MEFSARHLGIDWEKLMTLWKTRWMSVNDIGEWGFYQIYQQLMGMETQQLFFLGMGGFVSDGDWAG